MNTKKGNIVFWSIIVLVVLFIVIAIIDKSLDKPDDVRASVTETTDITTFDRFYHPSAFVIDSLIRKAEGFEGYDYFNYLKGLRLPLKENALVTAKEYPPFVSLYSPQSIIVQNAYHASQKMNTYTAEEAKSDVIENVLSFKTTAYKDIYDTSKQFHVVLRQGETVLQPASNGYKSNSIKSNVSYDDDLSPTSKQYNREEGYAVFSVGEEIDFNKPAEVLFLYNGKDDYAVYELDFKKFIGN
ncbi:hypothetical protein [Paenibacillus amylolyticus]|uniref:Uncharacterized protein n=1 Tax=Paenibacillus amylolyticus TaxID=1451 RepID=A0A100VMC7_PAEAM|nr:hypothetical protein [Paenibacillus amylolyticus]GAS82379.1 unknown protein [Paenibacillus amylolyticus]